MIRASDYQLASADIYETYFDTEAVSVGGFERGERRTAQKAPTDILTFHHHDRWFVQCSPHNRLGCLNRGG